MKKILALLLALMLVLSTTALAAVSSSGSKSSSSPTKSSSTYKPSAPAKSIDEKAPAVQQKPAAQPNTPAPGQQTSSSGGFWRNAAMFGTGMLAGSLLSHLFGPMGGLSEILGLLLNLVLIFAVVTGLMWVWRKFRSNSDHEKNRKL